MSSTKTKPKPSRRARPAKPRATSSASTPKFPETLGPYVAEWIEEHCRHGPGDVYGERVNLLKTERAFLDEAYAIDPHTGRRKVKVGIFERPKGSRKSELAGWLCITECYGPVRAYVDDDGDVVAGPPKDPQIVIAATTEDQAEATTYSAIRAIISASPTLEPRFNVGLERILLTEGPGKMMLVPTGRPGALDGARPTFQVSEELHVWKHPTLHDAWGTLRRNLKKRTAAQPWNFVPTTAYAHGEQSVLESLHLATGRHPTGIAIVGDLLYDKRGASMDWDLEDEEQRRAAVVEASGDCYWRDIDAICGEYDDPMVTVGEFRRYWLGQSVPAEDVFIKNDVWWGLHDKTLKLKPGDRICLGFDGSQTKDHTGIVAVRLEDGAVFVLGHWTPPGEGHAISGKAVDDLVQEIHKKYEVIRAYADPPRWQDWVSKWCFEYEDIWAEWWTQRPTQIDHALNRFLEAVGEKTISHDGHPQLAEHLANAHREIKNEKLGIRKENPWSERKIDLAMCAVLAWEARADAIEDGALRVVKRKVYAFR